MGMEASLVIILAAGNIGAVNWSFSLTGLWFKKDHTWRTASKILIPNRTWCWNMGSWMSSLMPYWDETFGDPGMGMTTFPKWEKCDSIKYGQREDGVTLQKRPQFFLSLYAHPFVNFLLLPSMVRFYLSTSGIGVGFGMGLVNRMWQNSIFLWEFWASAQPSSVASTPACLKCYPKTTTVKKSEIKHSRKLS